MRQDLEQARKTIIAGSLRNCQLFSGISSDELEEISSFVIPKRVAKGEYLFYAGSTVDGFYVVQQGSINVHRVSSSGKEQVIHVFRAGQSFAEAAVASDGGYPADARAIEDSTVLLVPKTDFLGVVRKRPELALRMLAAMSQHLRVLVGLLDDLTLKSVETRLAHWLLKRCPRPVPALPTTFALDRTKRVLAAELGTVSETLSRTFAEFRTKGLVTVSGKTITISAPRALEQLLKRNLGEKA